jgi:hypothetical protein
MLLAESTRLLSLLNFLPPIREDRWKKVKIEQNPPGEEFARYFLVFYFSIKELIGK